MKCGRCGQILAVNGPNATCVCCGTVYGPEQEPLPTEPAKVESEPTDGEILDWLNLNGRIAKFSDGWNAWTSGKAGVQYINCDVRAAIKQAMREGK